jgi:L-ascorbate metabolism protein UlaG (beta-lactamase superfamily)
MPPADRAPASTDQASLFFVGNATVLLALGPFTVLTDPNFLHRGQRAYLGRGLTSRRLTEPALDVRDLPDVDVVVLSHMHGDHWDRVARRHLDKTTPIVTTPHAARRLQVRDGFRRAVGLATWETEVRTKDGWNLSVTALPGRHAPGPAHRILPPVMGSLLELTEPDTRAVVIRIYVTGDTLMYDEVREIAARHPDIDTCVVHLGGTTLPGGLMVTMDGRQGADVVEMIRPRQVVPVHYEDYTVFKSGLDDFRREVDARGLTDLVTYVAPGDTVDLPTRDEGRADGAATPVLDLTDGKSSGLPRR